jgi:hypothetical protein
MHGDARGLRGLAAAAAAASDARGLRGTVLMLGLLRADARGLGGGRCPEGDDARALLL